MRIHHANIRAVDPVPLVDFYRLLGLKLTGCYDLRGPKAIYMGGTQDYEYDGAADAYRNVSFQRPDRGTSDLPRAVRRDYSGDYSGARRDELRRALELYGVTSSIVSSEDATYQAVTQAPVLVRLNAFGDSGLRHYGVLSGYDPRGSRERALHAVRLVDSYDNWRASRERRPTVRTIGVREFFDGAGSSGGAAWFREGIRLQIPGTEEARQNTFVVDVGHNPVNGIVTEAGRITLDEVARWRFKYHGPYFYHSGTGSRAVRWSPGIRRAGRYEVTVFAPTGPAMGSTRYTLHDARGVELASRDVDQYSRRAGTSDVVLAADRELGPGAYVRVAALAAGTGVRAVRFRWIAAPAGRR